MPAMLWAEAGGGNVTCNVCAHGCLIHEGKSGLCGVRVNYQGRMLSLVENIATGVQMDPVEKKPLYHFLPGTKTFSMGSAGCNFSCRFCQNSDIAHVKPKSTVIGRKLDADTIVRAAEENGAPSISYTYNEPTVFFEQVYNSSGLARAHGLRNILVSNGFMSGEVLQALSRRIDAANIDLKSFSDSFYRKYCGGRLAPVLDNLRAIRRMGWWLEVTTLLIPGVNDSDQEVAEIAAFIGQELGNDVPWHISAFHGAAQMINHPATTPAALERAWEIGRDAGLEYVYTGNLPTKSGQDTHCPKCGARVIERKGYRTRSLIRNGACPKCKEAIPGVWA